MPIAAVPSYLGSNFKDASPALRFGLLLSIWTNRQDQEAEVRDRARKRSPEGQRVDALLNQQGMDATIAQLCAAPQRPLPGLWEKNDHAAKTAWDKVIALTRQDVERMHALFVRQSHQAQVTPHTLTLDAIATAPFTTGLGNEHPLENGFAFLTPYGLPYLAGSGVKGVLRQAARELASPQWDSASGWSEDKRYAIRVDGKQVDLSMLDVLFGLESNDGDKHHVRGALSFWDAIPQMPGDRLHVEVMTPHQSHYYQQKKDRRAGDSSTPHDSGQPTPICFLILPPHTRFAFHVQCDLAHLKRLAPELAENQQWQTFITAAFEHAFEWLGFGAKTAVGYGAMQSQAQRQRQEQAEQERARQQQAEAKLEEARRLEQDAETWSGARLKFNAKNGALSAEKGGQTAIAIAPKGAQLLGSLPAAIQQKVKTNQFVKVTARVARGTLLDVQA